MKHALVDIREDSEFDEAVEKLLDSLGYPKDKDTSVAPTESGEKKPSDDADSE